MSEKISLDSSEKLYKYQGDKESFVKLAKKLLKLIFFLLDMFKFTIFRIYVCICTFGSAVCFISAFL